MLAILANPFANGLQRIRNIVLAPNSCILFVYLFGDRIMLLQINYSLVVILELNSASEVQYKEIMIIGDK